MRKRVLVLGGGFGGLTVAMGLDKALCDVTLVDHNNYHLFQPLLYQVATGELQSEAIATPFRRILPKAGIHFILGEVLEVVF
jgi:NADH dehydrogenase